MADELPGKLEATAAAFAGLAFAGGALLLRHATPVPAGMFDGLALVLASWGLSMLIHRLAGRAGANLARGIGFAGGSVLMTTSLLPPFDRAALPLAAWLLGAAFLQAGTHAKGWRVPFAVAGLALLSTGAVIGWIAADAWPETTRLRMALMATGVLAIAGLIARAIVARKHPRLAPSPMGILFLAALAASYFAYRPLVATRVANLPLYEWTLGVGAALLLLGRLRSGARETAVNDAWSGEGHRHRQDAAPAFDPRMITAAAMLQRYLDTGDGFEEYRNAMLRLAPEAPSPFRKTLQGARPVQGRGRAGKAARRERLVTHEALMELLHGHPEPHLRAHP